MPRFPCSDRIWKEAETTGWGQGHVPGSGPAVPSLGNSQHSNTFSSQDKSRCFALIKTNKDFSVLNRLIIFRH